MTTLSSLPVTPPELGADARRNLILIERNRVFYSGLLGRPTARAIGALTVYASDRAPLRVRIGSGEWETVQAAVVAPFVEHQIMGAERHIHCLLIEPEHLDLAALPQALQPPAFRDHQDELAARVRLAFGELAAASSGEGCAALDFDSLFFSAPLPTRRMDPRIASAVAHICDDPAGAFSAQDGAAICKLSPSRFLHLFKAEVGVSFRNFRTWKRARSLLLHAKSPASLTDIALDIGYPDSSYFSHEIRRVYGLRPKDIVAGSRDLAFHHAG